jgi:8-oxo-dGTP pyrophosphatase MutT (NUDIX family)
MIAPSDGNTIFTPERFFSLAAARTSREPPPVRGDEKLGDHLLNPGFLPEGLTYRDAAVLIPVVARQPEATVILTQRTPHLSSHAGQIAFPGGKIEPGDRDPGAAALREAEEEIGLAPDMVMLVGYLDPYLTRTGYRIVPVVGRVDPRFRLRLNAEEVEEAFEVPLAFLMSVENHRQSSRVLLGRPRYFYEMPFEGRYIWGVTAGIIRALYERVLG